MAEEEERRVGGGGGGGGGGGAEAAAVPPLTLPAIEMPGLACLACVAAREESTEQAAAALSPACHPPVPRLPACLTALVDIDNRERKGGKIFVVVVVVVVVMRYRDRLSVCLSVSPH